MLVEHTLTVCARCPVNELRDVYEVTFRLNRLIKVEELLTITGEYSGKKIFQEELTQAMADRLQCIVESRGTHSGVKTKVICEPKDETNG